MNYSRAIPFVRPLRFAASLFALCAMLASAAFAADAGTGTVSGSVTSAGTRNALQGATVTVGNQTGLTDSAGAYSISGVPAGSAQVVISYPGFTESSQTVSVTAGGRTTSDVAMKSSDLVTMEKFTVESIKEGQALSIQEQRNAPNVKNVTAFDEWGILPTQNVGELVSRLPGITFTTDEDNLINQVSIGGMPGSYTRLNIDGMSSTGVGGDGRQATLHSFSGSMYEQVEIIAGQTPDKRADSLGGQLNLKTRSPLAMAENRRTTYTASGRYFPSTSKRNFVVGERPLRPDFSIMHTQVFDVNGGHRNLGVVINASYQEILNPHDWDVLLYDNAVGTPQLRDYQRQSGLNDRFISAISARADYRWSPSTLVSLRFLYNAGSEPFFNYNAINPFVNANLTINSATNPTGVIMPGYTDKRIEFAPVTNTTLQPGGVAVGAGQMRINPQRYSFTSKNPTGTLAFEHNWGRLKVDHAYRWSNTHWDSGAGRQRENGTIQVRTRGPVGFVLDYTNPHSNVFRQTAGPSVYDPASYAAFVITAANTTTQPVPVTSTVVNKRDTVTDTNEVSANVNLQYTFGSERPITVKTGLDTVNRRVNNLPVYPRRWYGVAGTFLPLNTGLMPLTEFERENGGGQRLPVYDPAAVSTTLNNPALWYEDVNFTATQQYTNRRIMEEGVDSAYIQASGRLGKLTILGGVRHESVTTDTFTYFRARTATVAQIPDHFARAANDYARLSRDGEYSKAFPSLHLSYDLTKNLKARASYSTSYGRAPLASLVAAVTPNDTARTVTMGNPELKPQLAENYDLKLEYYTNTGTFSVRGYRKDIDDYIGAAGRSGDLVETSPDNGFDGLYGGYEIIRPLNLGTAEVKGIEIDVRQRLTFLPGPLKGLTVRGNYTALKTEGNFGGTVSITTNAVANFVPKAYNLGLMYTYGKFGANFDVNHTGKWPLLNVSATSPQTARFRQAWTIMNAGVSYQVYRSTTFFLSASNIAQEGRKEFIYVPERVRSEWVIPISLKFGITGQF